MSRWTVPSRKIRWAIWIAIVLGPVATTIGLIDFYSDQKLLREGLRIEAEVKDFRRFPTKSGQRYEYDLTFQLPKFPEKTFLKTFYIASSDIPGDPPLESITLISHPEDPKQSRLIYGSQDKERFIVPAIVTAFGFVALVFVRHLDRKNLARFEREIAEVHARDPS
ncbi:hypothetical protein FEM03_19345 [Phragmitibacter flavus]|uniref:DUF3592 domain-containing protein n=1 Tax=Phragmitibacter flavus TaxID=2576071 RepID=A0A5R8K9Q8_9BACT|nr:hypothetical protein [Phragmitibacter flavus]TLD69026.1 hypothetical protein FEM03_19345 [Phragmitibacter flavus]